MSVLEKLIGLYAPHLCLGCGFEGNRLLCDACAGNLAKVPSRCYRCKATTINYSVCDNCRPKTALRQVAVFTHHKEVAKELVHSMKYERASSGMAEAAALMHPLLGYLPENSSLVHIPTATRRVRQRGHDHALLLAHHLSRLAGIESVTHLARTGQAHQVGSSRAERLRQLQNAFRPAGPLKGKNIILVDDVLTTGATLEAAARELKRAGARTVSALVFAQA